MKKLLLSLLTLGCMTSVLPSQLVESRKTICNELWRDVKTMVIVHPYATVFVTALFFYFIFLYQEDAPSYEGVSNYTKQNLEMHACIPAHVKRPPDFWKKPVQPIQEESEL